MEDAWAVWGGLDIWLNNAGADTLTGEAGRWPFARKLEDLGIFLPKVTTPTVAGEMPAPEEQR